MLKYIEIVLISGGFTMDVFIEYMVKRKKKAADYIKILATLVLGLILIYIVTNVFFMIPFITSFVLVAIAGVIYGMYYFITSVNVEYEYILTNNELDVDSILNTKRRKRLTTVNIRQIETWGQIGEKRAESYSDNKSLKKIYACKDIDDSETYFLVYYHDDDKNMLLFNPNEKILQRIERLNPQRGI